MYNSPNCNATKVSSATDGFMTQNLEGTCEWANFLYITNFNSFVMISLPKESIVRTMLFSSRERYAQRSIGHTISVGESYVNSTLCFKSTTGLSSWITCNAGLGALGSNIYIAHSNGYIELYELMAFSE